MNATPITEFSNETTREIGSADAIGIVRILRQCDGQITNGWRHHPGMYDYEQQIDYLSCLIGEALLAHDKYRIVLSGCGTSGRIGFILANRFNALCFDQGIVTSAGLYKSLIAGGEKALFSSVEMPEDDWLQGKNDLKELMEDGKKILYIGISCGLSATYVASQLDFCMSCHGDDLIPVFIGFNPIYLARKSVVDKHADKSFYDVLSEMSVFLLDGAHKGVIIDPVIGPEAITGSTRMKGGSATKIILESALIKAHCNYSIPINLDVHNTLLTYQLVFTNTYRSLSSCQKAISWAGESLKRSRHVYYLAWGSPRLVAVLDASECVPTFSSSFDNVRAFIQGGLESYGVQGAGKETSIDYFIRDIVPSLTAHDTVVIICLSSNSEAQKVSKIIRDYNAKVFHLLLNDGRPDIFVGCHGNEKRVLNAKKESVKNIDDSRSDDAQISVHIDNSKLVSKNCQLSAHQDYFGVIKFDENNDGNSDDAQTVVHTDNSQLARNNNSPPLLQRIIKDCLDEMSVKVILNAISTGGHVIQGKVLGNLMIDVKVSNNKLFHRAVDIVQAVSGLSKDKAHTALLKAVYRVDHLPESTRENPVSKHVMAGTCQENVVPLAILLSSKKFNVKTGLKELEEGKRVVDVLSKLNK